MIRYSHVAFSRLGSVDMIIDMSTPVVVYTLFNVCAAV